MSRLDQKRKKKKKNHYVIIYFDSFYQTILTQFISCFVCSGKYGLLIKHPILYLNPTTLVLTTRMSSRKRK